MKTKILQSIEFVIVFNFFISVMLLITSSFLSFFEQYSFFEFNQDLYGELINHVKMVLLYISITELIICAYYAFTHHIESIALAGFFMILLVGSMSFYEKINAIELDENLFLFFLYVGSSHILFAIFSDLKNKAVN